MNFVPNMSNYARRMARLSARIFGEVSRPTDSKSMKVVRILSQQPNDLNPYVVDHYPPHVEYSKLIRVLREHGLFRFGNKVLEMVISNSILHQEYIIV
ncbi:28S ribosomal protein S33, mitochondrial-like [Stegodyphus dumicola]|uniref:28S ribosomal protein S33, mitochondrial-like n=1 Tax=Stegodyphus dumicola TaxID=202533 RepID=UPI0015AFEA9D|nr:28S ribosomal protein S33, mitochondrial-like [Stegodyphus dumicola]